MSNAPLGNDQEQVKLRRLERLAQVASEVMGNLEAMDLDDRLALIARRAKEILSAEACGIFLVKREGFVSLEASYGHRGDRFERGKEFAVGSKPEESITGYIAHEARVVNLRGAALSRYLVGRGGGVGHLPSGTLTSLLAVPLAKKQPGKEGRPIGFLKVENKRGTGPRGQAAFFTRQDERILSIFAEAVVVAIESAALVTHLDRLIASSPTSVIAVDRQGNITAFNALAERLLGYRSEEVTGQPVAPLYYDPTEPRKIGRKLHEATDGKVTNYLTAMRGKDGERVPIRLTATWLRDAQGKLAGSVGYFEDLRSVEESERRLELLMEASKVMTEAEDLRDGLGRLARMLATHLGVICCHVLLLDESERFLLSEAVCRRLDQGEDATGTRSIGTRIALAEWPELAAVLNQAGQMVVDRGDPARESFLEEWSRRLCLTREAESLLLIPLRAGNKVLGLLGMGETRAWSSASLSETTRRLATAIASHTAALINRLRAQEAAQRRSQLLKALDEKSAYLRADKGIHRLRHEIAGLAAQLVGFTDAALFTHWPHLGELAVSEVYGLPTALVNRRISHHEGPAGAIARSGKPAIIRDGEEAIARDGILGAQGWKTIAGVPLKGAAGDVEAVLLVGERTGQQPFGDAELEVLERFAARASIALQTTPPEQSVGQLAVLHQISDYIQGARDLDKILKVVLTGVTAGYGLGFNRAALLLLDDKDEALAGRTGIGHVDEAEAQADWERHAREGRESLQQFIALLEGDALPSTPLGTTIPRLRLPLRAAGDALSQAVAERRHVIVAPQDMDKLPDAFREAFRPSSTLVVAPLLVREKVIGLLIVDNKFTQSPIEPRDVESLLTFANTAAIAIDNERLLEQVQAEQEKLRSLYAASNPLIAPQDSEQVLRSIATQMRLAASADRVTMLLVDESGQPHTILTSKEGQQVGVLHAGEAKQGPTEAVPVDRPLIVENPRARPDVAALAWLPKRVGAALCLPFSVGGQPAGVVSILYDKPRRFSQFDVDALQLYLNLGGAAYDTARRMEELKGMRQAAEALAGAAGLPEVLQQIARGALDVLHADSAAIWSYDAARRRFITEDSVAVGIEPRQWEEFRRVGLEPGGTTDTVMERGWLAVTDLDDRQQYGFVGDNTRRLLKLIEVRSFQGISLGVTGDTLGVLYVNYKRPRHFSPEERQTAQGFANQAALVLKRARLLTQVRKAHYAAGVVARLMALEEDVHKTLRLIAKESLRVLGCDAVTLYSYNQERDEVGFPPAMAGVEHKREVLEKGGVEPGSIVHHILEVDDLHVAQDAGADATLKGNFVQREHIVSAVAMRLVALNRKVGVMFVNYRRQHEFTPDELENLRLFANQAAVAIYNAQQYDALKRAESLVGARTALAWMGMVSSTWRHAICNHAVTIEDLAELASLDIEADAPRGALQTRLGKIREMAGKIRGAPIVAPLPAEETGSSVSVNDLLRERVKQLLTSERYAGVEVQYSLGLGDGATVRAESAWLLKAFELLIENAARAMAKCETKKLTITTREVHGRAEITIADTGRGIPDHVLPHLFKEPIPKAVGDTGLGMGLLIAQLIVHAHRGEISHVSGAERGTTMRIWLPLEEK